MLYVLLVSIVLFLFFGLMLDVFCFLAFGGWNPLLGSWPIFSGTVSSAFYSSGGSVISLIIGFSLMARVILGQNIPTVLLFLVPNQNGDLKEEL